MNRRRIFIVRSLFMNLNNDYILRLAESVGKLSAKVFFHKEPKEVENICLESISGQDILPILIKRLIYENKYNEAEDIIFEELYKNPSIEIYDVAKNFYDALISKSNEELEKANFKREEIYLGLADIQKIIFNEF